MAPLPRVRQDEPLEPGQTTIFNTLNSGLGLHRPNPPRPGRVPKPSGQSNTVLGRRLIGGENKKYIVKLFATIRLTQEDNGEPRDVDIANNKELPEEDDKDFEYMPSGKRYTYSREHKLAAIDYFQTT
jgi:hypothetical protein